MTGSGTMDNRTIRWGGRLRTGLALGLVCLLMWTLVPGGLLAPLAQAEPLTPEVKEVRLPTGQMLYIKEDHSKPIVTIDTWVRTGSVNETADNNGVSHFLEHLLFKGTSQYGPGQLDRILESRGAQFNAATSDDYTHYYITTATPYFEEALRLHAEMMLNAAIPEAELPQERKVVQEEINRANDNPDRQLYVALSRLLYQNHGYAQDTLGPKEVIATLPRQAILDYYHYWYQPQNFNTVIVGDVRAADVERLVREVFPAPTYQQPGRYQPPVVSAVPPPTSVRSDVIANPTVSQVYLGLGMLGPALQKPDDVYALDIAMLALGSGKSSRLYEALREKRPLATSVWAGNYTQKHSGLLMVSAQAQPEHRDAVKQEIVQQLAALKAHGISQDELDKAKTQYLKDFVFQNETSRGTASSIGYNVTIGSLADYRNHVRHVQAVTLDQVQDALERYIHLDRAVLVELLPSAMAVDPQAEARKNETLLSQSAASVAHVARPAALQRTVSSVSAAQPEKRVLKNGMTLVVKPLPDSATVALKIFVKGGRGVEVLPGVASLVSSVMMQGTQARTAEQVSLELERQGMNLSIAADDDFIEVTGTAVQADFPALMGILSDVLAHPAFEPSEIAKKKAQLLQSVQAARDNPSAVAFENLSLALYPAHPYGNEGRRVEVSLDQIQRQHLLDYYHLYFRPENMVVSVVGQVDPQQVSSYLESMLPPCHHCPHSAVSVPPVAPLAENQTVSEALPQLSAVWMTQGWLAPAINSPDYVALKVLNSLLGTGMSSRLFVALRERQGLAYVVGSLYPSRSQQSRFAIYIGSDPANLERVQAGFHREIQRLQDEPVPVSELEEAKSKLIGSFALSHDSNASQAYYLGLYETLGMGYQYDTTYSALVEQVTPGDIQRVARRYFTAPGVTSLVQPKPPAASSAPVVEPSEPVEPAAAAGAPSSPSSHTSQ